MKYEYECREEIQRIKANNPDISHKEAFSTAAKNVSDHNIYTDTHTLQVIKRKSLTINLNLVFLLGLVLV